MSDSERRLFGSLLPLINGISASTKLFSARKALKISSSLLKQFILIIALTTLLAPSMAFADPFLMLHDDGSISPLHATEGQAIKRSLTVGLNENGDLMIRHSDVSLIVAYNHPNDINDHQEWIRTAQRQDSPAISGISLKVSLLF